MKFLMKVVAAVVGVLVIAGAAIWGSSAILGTPIFGASAETTNTQVVKAIERKEEIALLSVSIQGIAETNGQSQIFGFTVPGTTRTRFLQYNFDAKLGVNGEDVVLTETGENAFTVEVPEFIFIGHSNVSFQTAVDQNGVLSWVTPEVDTAAVATEILSDDSQQELVVKNVDLLKDQTTNYYTSLIQGIVPDAEVTVEFGDNFGDVTP